MIPVMRGVDVSEHQGNIKWGTAKKYVDFAIIRAGFGKNNVDKRAIQNIKGCVENNIPFGLYWFSYAYTVDMAREEAKYMLELVKDQIPLLPLYFDFEDDSVNYAKKKGVKITNQLLLEMTEAFCKELENAGYYAGIYANANYVNNKYGKGFFNLYDLWYAKWGGDKPDRSVNLWQYSSTGSVPGISGNVDLDYAYIDFPALIKKRGLNGYKEEPKFECPHGCPHCPNSKK